MRTGVKAVITALTVCSTLLLSAPAAQAAGEWMSKSSPTKVRNNSGTVLGHAYGKASVSTTNANNTASYRRVAGDYSIYVRSTFYFYYYDTPRKQTGWWLEGTAVHNGTYTKNKWKTNTRGNKLHPQAEKARVFSVACTEVPFLVPGNCTGTHIVTMSY